MKLKILAIIGVLMLLGSTFGVAVAKADNPVSQSVTTNIMPVTLCVSITPVSWTGDFGNVVVGTFSASHEIDVVNCSNVVATLAVTGSTGFYQTCLQISTNNVDWVDVGQGWTTAATAGQTIPLYFRVNVPSGATPSVYAGSINFIVSQ